MLEIIYRILAAAFAMTIIVTSPATALTTHAQRLNIDAPTNNSDDGERPADYGHSSSSSSSSSNESSSVTYEPSTPSNSDSGSSSHSGSSNSGSSDSSSYTVAAPKNPNDVIVRVAGGQTFRNVMNANHTSYQVYHCGDSKVTFTVTDANDNVVEFKTVKLEQGEDKLWYENITFADDVDVKGLTLNVTKGDATYLSTELGVSVIKINGTVVLSTVPAPAETDKTEEAEPIGYRVCTCGYVMDIYTYGLSSEEKASWSSHAAEHLANGIAVRYTDKAYH